MRMESTTWSAEPAIQVVDKSVHVLLRENGVSENGVSPGYRRKSLSVLPVAALSNQLRVSGPHLFGGKSGGLCQNVRLVVPGKGQPADGFVFLPA